MNLLFVTSEFHRLAVRNHRDLKLTFSEITTILVGRASSGQVVHRRLAAVSVGLCGERGTVMSQCSVRLARVVFKDWAPTA